MFYVYWKCNGIPPIKPFWRKQTKMLSYDFRHYVFWMSLVMVTYNFFHYSILQDDKRAKHYGLIELLRFNVLILITLYYLRSSSEEILKRRKYLQIKKLLLTFYIAQMTISIIGGINLYIEVTYNNLKSDQFCVHWFFKILRYGSVLTMLLFLFIALQIQKMLDI